MGDMPRYEKHPRYKARTNPNREIRVHEVPKALLASVSPPRMATAPILAKVADIPKVVTAKKRGSAVTKPCQRADPTISVMPVREYQFERASGTAPYIADLFVNGLEK